MSNYRTPGVYVEEIPKFPPSVAQVATAIPAFIGRTEKGAANKPTRITSLLEFETLFGGPENKQYTVDIQAAPTNDPQQTMLVPSIQEPTGDNAYKNCILHSCLQLYFANGGGPCYIVSVGGHTAISKAKQFTDALATLEKVDEPTLILMPEAQQLDDYGTTIVPAVLAQCAKLKDRFGIFDFDYDKDKVEDFRYSLGMEHLNYGAAYTPFLNTTIPYAYDENTVTLTWKGDAKIKISANKKARLDAEKKAKEDAATKTDFKNKLEAFQTVYKENLADLTGGDAAKKKTAENNINAALKALKIAKEKFDTVREVASAADYQQSQSDLDAQLEHIKKTGTNNDYVKSGEEIEYKAADTAAKKLSAYLESAGKSGSHTGAPADGSTYETFATLAELKDKSTLLYNQITALLAKERMTLPPSAAAAGIYAAVDRQRGVWKAPANVSVASVIGPKYKFNNEEQSGLNIDPTSGKSINVIRSFAGKGSIVWGARTLEGNSNEWRYINVRRLFITIEESVQKATAFAVFEPNDATTWLKVKAMIDSYLYGLWQQGALAGIKPEDAYFVHVGLGKTMTTDDILNGYMNVEIGIAAVRPAEFIVLKFSHKLQES